MACGVVEYKSKAIKQHSDGAFKMAEYAIPISVETIEETDEIIVQRAIMLNSDDAIAYARQCREFGAGYWICKNGLEVVVVYSLDADGKISV
jgi:hypothetical protein